MVILMALPGRGIKVDICGAVGEIDFRNEFIVSTKKADDKKPTAAVAKMAAGVPDTNSPTLYLE